MQVINNGDDILGVDNCPKCILPFEIFKRDINVIKAQLK